MNINFSICITYYYERNNIIELLNELKLSENPDVEVLIFNDNYLSKLNIKKQTNIKVFNNTSNIPIGEIKSIKFLTSKASGKYISIIADDDLMHSNLFSVIRNDSFSHSVYLSHCTTQKKKYKKRVQKKFLSQEQTIINFFKRNLYFSGTIAAFYEKHFIISVLAKVNIKKYMLDSYILMKSLDKNISFIDNYYGYNNTNSSRISSGIINLKVFNNDFIEIVKTIKKKDILFEFVKRTVFDYYSIVQRTQHKRILNFLNFCKIILNIKKISLTLKMKLIFIASYLLAKLILKKFIIF